MFCSSTRVKHVWKNSRAFLGIFPVVKIPRDSTGYGIIPVEFWKSRSRPNWSCGNVRDPDPVPCKLVPWNLGKSREIRVPSRADPWNFWDFPNPVQTSPVVSWSRGIYPVILWSRGIYPVISDTTGFHFSGVLGQQLSGYTCSTQSQEVMPSNPTYNHFF